MGYLFTDSRYTEQAKKECPEFKIIPDEPKKSNARLISLAKPWFIECKAYVRVGNSRERTVYENMPSHKDVKEFSIALSNELKKLGLNYPLKLEKKDSRVTLLTDRKDNMFFKEN